MSQIKNVLKRMMRLTFLASVGFAVLLSLAQTNAALAATSPTLGTAGSFSVLAETNITNVPTSAIGGDVGLSPGTGAGIGLTCSEVTGTIYSVDAGGPLPCRVTNPGLLTTAINDMMTAFTTNTPTGINQGCDTTYPGVQDLTLVSPLVPGVYCADAFLLTGNLTLSGSGVWIFKSAATLTTSVGSSVTGGDPCNVWWRLVTAADIFTNSSIIGNILAGTSINLQVGASLQGRALAQAAVTLSGNTITQCAAGPPPGATLTLVKTVINDNGGSAPPTAWTLSATGPTSISGATGSAPVTNAPVSVGSYALSESGGPVGYTASTYSCVKNTLPPVVSNTIALAAGDTATCTITNNDIAPAAAIPTMTEWGMIIFMVLVGLMSIYYLRRQRAKA